MSRICQKCGGEVGEADFYCIHCGMPLEKVKQEEQQAFSQWEGVQTPSQEKPELAKPLSVKDYLLLGILLSIPVVNIILAILWAAGKNENPNRRNLACAWLIFAAAGAVISVIFMIGLVRAAWLSRIIRIIQSIMSIMTSIMMNTMMTGKNTTMTMMMTWNGSIIGRN